jgi:hypothetical protein
MIRNSLSTFEITDKTETNMHIDTRRVIKLLKMLMQNIQILAVDKTITLCESSDSVTISIASFLRYANINKYNLTVTN